MSYGMHKNENIVPECKNDTGLNMCSHE